MKVKTHLHLPRMKAGSDEVISVAPYIHVKGISKTTYAGTVCLQNVTFRVSKSGRERTLRDKVRNVHAWVIGDLLTSTPSQNPPKNVQWKQARYNPYQTETFVDTVSGNEVHSAHAAYMVGSKVYYL